MRHLAILTLILFASLLLAGPRRGSWGTGSCGPGGRDVAPDLELTGRFSTPAAPVGSRWTATSQADLRWLEYADSPDEIYLYAGNRHVGNFSYSTGEYRQLQGATWGNPGPPPVRAPERAPAAKVDPAPAALPKADKRPEVDAPKALPKDPFTPESEAVTQATLEKEGFHFGVEWDKAVTGKERFDISGQPCPREEACKVFTADGKIVDQSGKWHLWACWKDQSKKKPLARDMQNTPELAALAGNFRVQEYCLADIPSQKILEPFDLEHDKRFQESGFILVAQAPEGPDGKSVPHVRYDYPAPTELAKELGNLRARDPSYTPDKNPSMSGSSGNFGPLPWWGWLLGLFILVTVTPAPAKETSYVTGER